MTHADLSQAQRASISASGAEEPTTDGLIRLGSDEGKATLKLSLEHLRRIRPLQSTAGESNVRHSPPGPRSAFHPHVDPRSALGICHCSTRRRGWGSGSKGGVMIESDE